MLFNTWQFAVFFVVVYTLYLSLRFRPQSIMLLLASWLFYACWNWKFLFLLLASTIIDYTVGRLLENADGSARRRLVTVSIVVNLTILGFFKYFNFFADSFSGLVGVLGLHVSPPVLRVILPVGISFYTFQAMAYTIDVYRRSAAPCRDFVSFALYVSYFPHLVAGPIQRTDDLLPQLLKPRTVTWDKIASGALLVLIGLVRKVAIADSVAPMVNAVFNNPGAQSSCQLLFGVFLFALQIYGDFAGYTDMARGVSRMMGIELIENFRQPYFSTNVQIFWTRWHISLSRWLRDYLYVPLGGNRGPAWFVYRNLMLTMLLGGLWHGASWNFVIWGGLHGLALAVHRYFSRGRRKTGGAESVEVPLMRGIKAVASWALTMLVVGVTWVFFRARTLGAALGILGGIVHWHGGLPPLKTLLDPLPVILLLLCIDVPQYLSGEHEVCRRWPWLLQGVIYAVLVLALLTWRPNTNAPFIYFQF